MKTQVQAALAKSFYIGFLSLILIISSIFFADFQTLGIKSELPLPTMDQFQIKEVQNVPIRGKIFKVSYFMNSELITFKGFNGHMERTCAGYFKQKIGRNTSFLGYHVVRPTDFKGTVLEGLNVSCIPLNNKNNWADFKNLEVFFTVLTVFEVIMYVVAVSLVFIRLESWCTCRNMNGQLYNMC
ncbi:Hypothetical_protein [Hexamita inflata]|uniref:Hypothetical_protein n=1 Tax=Hexamita inflata TaxID=28002 RepID=A0AA86U954_9EUKA|nr:Hypothetical protein HINF_LOCUS20718 [Hexamita inflata]CAI9942282.1 Hypothetical protein HINF_LOCUS29927 [Hexamita inflata]CAI9955789.1 Hypothetical protein HINF_LOCUS43434 [Hexamita inflata]